MMVARIMLERNWADPRGNPTAICRLLENLPMQCGKENQHETYTDLIGERLLG